MHWAALNGRKEIVLLLLESKADPNMKNDFGKIPLEDGLQNGYREVSEILVKVSKLEEDKMYSAVTLDEIEEEKEH